MKGASPKDTSDFELKLKCLKRMERKDMVLTLSQHHINYVLVLAGCTSELQPLDHTFTDL